MPNTLNSIIQPEEFSSYADLIHEAFINPIRNITVIDDEYPTFAQYLSKQLDGSELPEAKSNIQNLERLRKIISLCHTEKSWGIDIFDGDSPNFGDIEQVPSHINHSDLVVLDYHLNGDDNGEKSRKIIEVLEDNNHFNIILVHTKGFDDGDIEKVFNEILCQFVKKSDNHHFAVTDDVEETIEDWLAEHDDGVEFAFFQQRMSIQDVLKHLAFSERQATQIRSTNHFLNSFQANVNEASVAIGITSDDLVKWYVREQIKVTERLFEGKCKGRLKWSWNGFDEPNYIATGRVFISVIKKGNGEPEEELIEPLKRSLIELDASPMHLLMAKMRYEIDEKGLEQANEIVSNREAQAGWLYNLITKSEDDVYEHDTVIDAHWEQLSRSTKHNLREFSIKLISAASKKDTGLPKDVVKHFFKECVGDRDNTLGHLNAFNCSQPLLGRHLTTGTVFKAEDAFWVCLSPACDLVPRKREHWESRIGSNYLAFKAVQLHKVDRISTANNNANSNEYIYLILDNKPTAFGFTSGKSNPIWDTFYADRCGVFSESGKVSLTCIRQNQRVIEQAAEPQEIRLELKSVVIEAVAIAELRYEYALNLLHKLGSNQTRVGLGFTDSASFLQ